MQTLVEIRHSIDTTDAFYEKENDYFNEVTANFQGLQSNFYEAIVNSKFRDSLEQKYGKLLFQLAELTLKTFNAAIIEDLQEENKLISEYDKLTASARILYQGEERNLSQMAPFMQSQSRETRKEASELYFQFFEENEEKFDTIYDQLVKVRTRIAKKLGYDNYVELGYAKLNRTDYTSTDVANYRQQVFESLVPVSKALRKRQQERLHYASLKYYDESFAFLSGNPKPKGNPEWILSNGAKMYQELSPETAEFFKFMTDHELLDLVSKKGKVGGGYCTFIGNQKAPFIFSNFNGTSHDIDVLTHEAGHGFQFYQSRNKEIPEYITPTLEACEIHSMSMEFFTYPWMDSFFEEDTEKYKFNHLSQSLLFIPYGVTVDEFQHYVYEHPEATPLERKHKWRELEKKYLPHKNYDGNAFLERGGFWFKQSHIFSVPFYYIDYTLAQVCAFQFYLKSLDNREQAWDDYINLCNEGGSKSFLDLLKVAHLNNPFIDGTIKAVSEPLLDLLNQYNDKEM
jgi:M3 family oligoendopeptidase